MTTLPILCIIWKLDILTFLLLSEVLKTQFVILSICHFLFEKLKFHHLYFIQSSVKKAKETELENLRSNLPSFYAVTSKILRTDPLDHPGMLQFKVRVPVPIEVFVNITNLTVLSFLYKLSIEVSLKNKVASSGIWTHNTDHHWFTSLMLIPLC